MQYLALFLSAMPAFVATVCARPSSIGSEPAASFLISDAQLAHWLATTDAELTFVGERPTFNPLSRRAAQTTIVTYCTKRLGNICTGTCTVYNGGAACIDSDPDTQCIAANKDVGFCDKDGCDGTCSSLSLCGTHLDDNFCFTPETKSIVVSPL